MRFPFRRRVVLENLARPRLGLSELEVRAVQRPRSSSLIAVASAGSGFKFDGQAIPLAVSTHKSALEVPSERYAG